jgi:hypothetical protein
MKLTIEKLNENNWILRKNGIYVSSFSTKSAAEKYIENNKAFLESFLTN